MTEPQEDSVRLRNTILLDFDALRSFYALDGYGFCRRAWALDKTKPTSSNSPTRNGTIAPKLVGKFDIASNEIERSAVKLRPA